MTSEAEAMRDLLTYANYAKVAAALGVSRNAVRQWANGRDVTPYRLRQVQDLLRPQTAKEAAPITGRLLAGTIALERKLGVSGVELAAAEAEALVLMARLLEEAGTRPPPANGGGSAASAD